MSDDTERAYQILVSEVMLQQTQVERVRVIFVDFLKQFPRLRDLARASNREVILAWRGMGYNSRALRLRDAARHIAGKFLVSGCWLLVGEHKTKNQKPVTKNHHPTTKNHFPKSMEELQSIPGIGHYTAAAILNFAFNIPTPCIDTNIRRILHRTFIGPENPDGTWKKDDRYLLRLAGEVLQLACHDELVEPWARVSTLRRAQGDTLPYIPHDARNWHAALMDFGSLVQTKSKPKWEECPLTARGLMVTTKSSFEGSNQKPVTKNQKLRESGRIIRGRFTPNRIIRGRIVEALRDARQGLPLDIIGRTVCTDWSKKRHQEWLSEIVEKLKRDKLITCKRKKYILAD
ncbi:MAG: hypothetical protein PHS73_02575 [Candidatus Peribacteraceae bacterium]|nr:hypothetical protein [Candidatus Peribacteraceae bacterium]